jgi:hypothetical protein
VGLGWRTEVDPFVWTDLWPSLVVERANQEAAQRPSVHSGLESALGSRPCVALSSYQAPSLSGSRDDRVQLVRSVDHMNTNVSGRESVNAASEPGRDLLETDVFDGRESVRAKSRCNASRFETADRTFIKFLKPFGPLRV